MRMPEYLIYKKHLTAEFAENAEGNQGVRIKNPAHLNSKLRYHSKALFVFANFAPLREQLPFLCRRNAQ